jgi:hypothetical protein
MDEFTQAYLEAALWSSNDESNEQGGEPLDANYSISDIHPETLAEMTADCQAFQTIHADDIEAGLGSATAGHGCGFWDGDWPEPQAHRLDIASDAAGEYHLEVGDDGKIHGYKC